MEAALTLLSSSSDFRRTKDASKVARKRISETGQKGHRRIKRLGNPNGAAALRRAGRGNAAAIATGSANADQRARDLAEVKDIRANGAVTLEAIANELNGRERMAPSGGRWYPSSVANLLRRLEA
ncbi:hypothetical protein [Bradyrhizobium sp. USDA 4454]